MCGILGFVSLGDVQLPTRPSFERALAMLERRGPDDVGVWEEPEALLGHRRLSVLDLSQAGHQPMRSSEGRYVIVFNGEVYNFRELRTTLSAQGVQFRSQTDTEVILELYAREGPRCVERMRGMFALAIWDTRERRLFLARDRLGIKPLYIWRKSNALGFASELRALRALPGVGRSIDPAAVFGYLTWGHVPAPVTMFEDVESLPPGSWLLLGADRGEERVYWTIPAEAPTYTTKGAALEALRPALLDAVRLRCIADVPLGAFLSGGVDSSAVVALMRAAGQRDIRTFSVTFPDSEFDETSYARLIARRFETTHTAVPTTEQSVRSLLPSFFDAMDQPTCDGINTYLVSKLAKEAGLTVALSGLGGDEVFGGYPTFRRARLTQFWLRHVPAAARSAAVSAAIRIRPSLAKLEAFGLPGEVLAQAYLASRGLFARTQIFELLRGDSRAWDGRLAASMVPSQPEVGSAFHSTMNFELRRYMHDQLLRDSDVFGMAHGLEIRVPLIDHEVVEIVARTQDDIVLAGQHKALLRDALPTALPDEIVWRPKMGFTFPFESWIRTQWRSTLEELLSADSQVLDRKAVRRVWSDFLEGRVHWSRPWALYVLLRWLAEHSPS